MTSTTFPTTRLVPCFQCGRILLLVHVGLSITGICCLKSKSHRGRHHGFSFPALMPITVVRFPEPIYHSLETQNVVLSEPYNLPDPNVPDEVAETEAFVDWFSDYVTPGQNPGEPASDIYVPILDHNFDTIRIADDTEDRPKLVGLMVRGRVPLGRRPTVQVEGSHVSFSDSLDDHHLLAGSHQRYSASWFQWGGGSFRE